jgi:hypothetical protein
MLLLFHRLLSFGSSNLGLPVITIGRVILVIYVLIFKISIVIGILKVET